MNGVVVGRIEPHRFDLHETGEALRMISAPQRSRLETCANAAQDLWDLLKESENSRFEVLRYLDAELIDKLIAVKAAIS